MDDQPGTTEKYVFLPSTTGDGVLIRRNEVVGARPSGPNNGSVVYTAAGPSIYTSLPTPQLARLFDAEKVELAA